jgi:hypothetical protein
LCCIALLCLALRAGEGVAWEVTNLVRIEHGPLRVDHSKSLAEITLAQTKGGFPAKYGLGLFQNEMKTELRVEAPETAPTSRRLNLTTRIVTAPVIYVAREFPKDSCAWRVIVDHEMLHQLFDLEVLRAMPDEIRAITRLVFSRDELDGTGKLDLERARSRFFRQYKYVYDALSLPRHQRIDNPESYRRASALCGGEITRLLAGKEP